MVASVGADAAPSQGASYFKRDGHCAEDDPSHRAAGTRPAGGRQNCA